MHEISSEHLKLEKKGNLGKTALLALGVGQVIGAGVITLCGQAMGITGRSAWLAYGIAVIIGFLMVVPYVFLSSTIIVKGGCYSIIKAMSGERLAGMYVVSYITESIGMSLMGVSLGFYLHSLWPFLNQKFVAIFFIVLFYIINLLGVSSMAKAQKIMSAILVTCLMIFIVFGFTKLDYIVFDFKSEEFFTGGKIGFLDAIFLFVYSTRGYFMTINYASDSKYPKRDMPWALIMVVPIIMVIYVGVAIVAAGTLPLADVINQPLTNVANHIMPKALFIIFMVGGPIMALLTTINSSYASMAAPHMQAARDGWYPQFIAKCNRREAPYVILTIIFLIGLIPILLDFDISTITRNITLVSTVTMAMSTFVVWNLPKKYPEQWKNSICHIPDIGFYFVMILSIIVYLVVFIALINTLNLTIVIVSISVLIVCSIYANIRYKSGKVKVTASYWLD